LTVKLFVLEPKPFDGLVERQCGFYLGHVWGGVDCFGGVGGGWLCCVLFDPNAALQDKEDDAMVCPVALLQLI
jgi:hypothetical protein